MGFYTIYPREIENVRFRTHARVVDIRDRTEYRKYHYKGALNVPYKEEDDWGSCFPRSRPLILYCEYGNTSLLAARQLGKKGYEVYTVIGGARSMREQEIF